MAQKRANQLGNAMPKKINLPLPKLIISGTAVVRDEKTKKIKYDDPSLKGTYNEDVSSDS